MWVRDRREAILPAGWRAFPTDYVYIVTNRRERLDIGVTNELERCVCELGAGFSSALPATRNSKISAARKIAALHRVGPTGQT